MSWRRALVRVWLTLSFMWVAVIAFLLYPLIESGFEKAARLDRSAPVRLPVDCAQARGVEGVDYARQSRGPWEQYRSDGLMHLCWYDPATFRQRFPEFSHLSDTRLATQLFGAANLGFSPPADPWRDVGRALLIALTPLLVLAAGAARFSAKRRLTPAPNVRNNRRIVGTDDANVDG